MLFSGKIPSQVATRLTARYWVPYLLLFATIRHYLPLFETVRHHSHYSYYSLFAIRDYSLFAIRDYSLFAIRVFQTPESNKHVTCAQRKDTTSLSPPVSSNCSPADPRRVENFEAIPRETAIAQRYLILSLRSSSLSLAAPW